MTEQELADTENTLRKYEEYLISKEELLEETLESLDKGDVLMRSIFAGVGLVTGLMLSELIQYV